MEASKSAAPAANRPSVALDIVRRAGASILAGLVTAAVAAAVVILLSGSGDASSDAPTVPASSTPDPLRRSRSARSQLQGRRKRAPTLGNPEWMADLEYVWRMRTHDPLQRLNKRAVRQRKRAREHTRRGESAQAVAMSRSAEWSEHRAQAMALPRAELLAACGTRWRKIACACGPREVRVGCGQVQLWPAGRRGPAAPHRLVGAGQRLDHGHGRPSDQGGPPASRPARPSSSRSDSAWLCRR